MRKKDAFKHPFFNLFQNKKTRANQSKSEHFRANQRKIFDNPAQKRIFHGFVKKIVDICKFLLYILYYYNKHFAR
ncbi:MAG: hypothetical protein IJ264_01850, partial [Clostridia bacterium]|nr:hypothetical protein [Clostridia bacterium]